MSRAETPKFASAAEARAIVNRAKALRAEALSGMLRAAWARIARRRRAGATPMPARA